MGQHRGPVTLAAGGPARDFRAIPIAGQTGSIGEVGNNATRHCLPISNGATNLPNRHRFGPATPLADGRN
eukprot:4113618-Lingulodinium_polyedra.AAC.1